MRSGPSARLGLLSGLRNAAQSWVASANQLTCIKCLFLEIGTVAGNKKPMIDLAPQHSNSTDRWEISTKAPVRRIDVFRKNEPDTIVLLMLRVISQHEDE